MATKLSIDPEFLERALEVSREHTRKAAVTKALQEFIARRQQKRLLDLMGKLDWDASYDFKAGLSATSLKCDRCSSPDLIILRARRTPDQSL